MDINKKIFVLMDDASDFFPPQVWRIFNNNLNNRRSSKIKLFFCTSNNKFFLKKRKCCLPDKIKCRTFVTLVVMKAFWLVFCSEEPAIPSKATQLRFCGF